jgi:hypothetical protein
VQPASGTDVADQVRTARQRPLVARGEVVAELVHQLRGVGVEIHHADLGVERAGFVERQRHVLTVHASATACTPVQRSVVETRCEVQRSATYSPELHTRPRNSPKPRRVYVARISL